MKDSRGTASVARAGGRRPFRAVLAAGVVMVLAAGVGGCTRPARDADPRTGRNRPSTGTAQPHQAAVEDTLELMTDGIRQHDEDLFLSAVDGEQQAVVNRQRNVFRAMAGLPFQEPEYTWREDTTEKAEPDGSVTVVVNFRYRFRGWDDRLVEDPVTYSFSEVDDRWLISADSRVGKDGDGEDLPDERFTEPWMSGVPQAVEQRAHVLAMGDAALRTDLSRLATRLEAVSGDVRRLWSGPTWNGKLIAYASFAPQFLQDWFKGRQTTLPDAAHPEGAGSMYAAEDQLYGSEGSPGPSRVGVSPYLLRAADREALPILRHEATHAAADYIGHRRPPLWMLEGAADFTGYRAPGATFDAEKSLNTYPPGYGQEAMADGTWKPKLLADSATFFEGTSSEDDTVYFDGFVAWLYVADTYGEPVVRRLYQAAEEQPDDATPAAVEAAALRAVLDTDRAAFVEAVRVYGITLAGGNA